MVEAQSTQPLLSSAVAGQIQNVAVETKGIHPTEVLPLEPRLLPFYYSRSVPATSSQGSLL